MGHDVGVVILAALEVRYEFGQAPGKLVEGLRLGALIAIVGDFLRLLLVETDVTDSVVLVCLHFYLVRCLGILVVVD